MRASNDGDLAASAERSLALLMRELDGLGINHLKDEPLSNHTSLGVGGPADLLVQPLNASELASVFERTRAFELPVRVLGAGSNILVSDLGVRGVVVHTAAMNSYEIGADGSVSADAGVHFPTLVKATANAGLRGLEGGVGIPGSLGGVVTMNAGTYEFVIGELVERVDVVSPEEGERRLVRGEFSFRYRESSFGNDMSVARAVLILDKDDPGAVKADMNRHMAYRKESQPVGVRSAGCIFKNPDGDSAGRLIDSLKLKGFSVGNARISARHANFIVHDGQASASEVMELIKLVRERVFKDTSVELEREVMIWN